MNEFICLVVCFWVFHILFIYFFITICVCVLFLQTYCCCFTSGVDVSMVFLEDDPPKSNHNIDDDDEKGGGMFLINPRIIHRSPERNMKPWNESCLVLPPTFTAVVLRDESVVVEYESLFTQKTERVTLNGELARAAQHEMDHNRGILILDHVTLDELENSVMRELERDRHEYRMNLAYSRYVDASFMDDDDDDRRLASSKKKKIWNVLPPPANAEEDAKAAVPCDETCLAERKAKIEARRALMKQSRSNTRRGDLLELSRQRAGLYNTTYRGVTCPPGIPCL